MKKSLLSVVSALICLSASAQAFQQSVPADGSTVQSLKSVAFEVEGYIMGTMYNAGYSVTDQNGQTYSATLSSTWTQSGPSTYQYAALVTLDERIYTAGTYTISLDENAFYCDRMQSVFTPAMSVTITVDGTATPETVTPDAYTSTPAAGSTVDGIDEITITYPDHTGLVAVAGAKAEVYNDRGRKVATGTYDTGTYGVNFAHFIPNEVITAPGTYTICLPADQFYFDDNKYEPSNTEIKFNVTVNGQYQFDNVEFSLEDYAELKEFSSVTLTYTDYETISLPDYGSYVYIYDEEGNKTNNSIYVSAYSVQGNTVPLSLYTPFDKPGEYTISIPKGFFLLGEEKRPSTPQTWHFTVLEPEPDNVTVDPADGAEVTALEQLTFTFHDASAIAAGGQWSMMGVHANGGGWRAYCMGSELVIEGNTATAPLTVVEGQEFQPGEVITFSVPKNYFTLTTDEGAFGSQALELTYTIIEGTTTGINTVEALQQGQVYDLQGRQVNTLRPGQIYLLQGKHIITKSIRHTR